MSGNLSDYDCATTSKGMSLEPIEKSTAEEIVRACVAHLFSLLGKNSKFVYAHRYLAPADTLGGYNLLRHCATVWFMCKAIRIIGIELASNEKEALRTAVGYIGRKSKEPSWIQEPLPTLCLTAKDVVKLGGAGLVPIMLREYAKLADDIDAGSLESLSIDDPESYCQRFENYIACQLNDGDFIHKRTFSTGDIFPFRSDYYTGEALFAMMQSTRHLPEIRTAMEHLLDSGYGLAVQSHWMAYATCAGLKAGYCDEEKAAAYLRRLIDSIISDPTYRARHQSTPIACRTEALVEILQTCRQGTYLSDHLPEASVRDAMTTAAENLSFQLGYYGQGQFRKGRSSDRVQVDYIQHNGASLLGWWQLSR
jgi:hypothetical protein